MKKRNLLALIELFIMKICKKVVLPCLTSSFKCFIVLAIENVSNFQMHNEPRLFQRIF